MVREQGEQTWSRPVRSPGRTVQLWAAANTFIPALDVYLLHSLSTQTLQDRCSGE